MDRALIQQILAIEDPAQRAAAFETAMNRHQQGSLQTVVDGWKDPTTRQTWLDEFSERGLSIDQGLDFKAGRATNFEGPAPLEAILWDYGINFRKSVLSDYGEWGPKFFQSGPAIALRAICDHAYYESLLGWRNMMTGNPLRHQVMQTRNQALYSQVSVGEPVIAFQERPMRDSERTKLKVMMQDLVATIEDLPPGTLEWRTVTSQVQFDDEDLFVQLEGTNGMIIEIKPSKDSWKLTARKAGIVVSDEFIAGNVRANLLMRTVMRIGIAVNRACVIRIANLVAEHLKTGTDRQGLERTYNTNKQPLNGKHFGRFEDRYEFDQLNRFIGKKSAIRTVKEMHMATGTGEMPYHQYMRNPTGFYDLGGIPGDIGLGGIASNKLTSSEYTDTTGFGYDVNITVVAAISPYLEQDEMERHPDSGMLCRYFRTSISEAIEDAESIYKLDWTP